MSAMAAAEQPANEPPLSMGKILPPMHAAPWHHKQFPRARWALHIQATIWRVLMRIGMHLHRLAPPKPPRPNFVKQIPATVSGKSGTIDLNFYVPKDHETQRRLYNVIENGDVAIDDVDVAATGEGKEARKAQRISATFSTIGLSIRRRSSLGRRWGTYPLVINFHGGGFTLGSATDDARWCATLVDECQAVVISVDYRLAPEHPFPTAVEDGVDVVLWAHKHAEQLGIDTDKIILSGFSSGGNMSFTIPLRLYDEINGFPRDGNSSRATSREPSMVPSASQGQVNTVDQESGSSATANNEARDASTTDPLSSSVNSCPPTSKGDVAITIDEQQTPEVSIRCIIAWYPPTDYTRSRDQRRATCRRSDQELPAVLTDLFDESYLYPSESIHLDSPYLSPGVAPVDLLKKALPQDIILTTCEWDMLLDEGETFKDRLLELGKTVSYQMVEGVPHGWDKAPSWKPIPGVRGHYLRACKELKRVLAN